MVVLVGLALAVAVLVGAREVARGSTDPNQVLLARAVTTGAAVFICLLLAIALLALAVLG